MSSTRRINEVMDFASEYVSQMLGHGTHTSRMLSCTTRLVESLGMHTEISTTLRHFTICISDDYGNSETRVVSIPSILVNFELISCLSALSWQVADQGLTLDEAKRRFRTVVGCRGMSPMMVLLLVAVANACFCHLFDGDLLAMGIVFIATLIGFRLRQYLTGRGINSYIVFAVCSFMASMTASVALALDCTAQTAIATSPLFLIPGVPLINGVIDIMDGHVLTGISRLVSATLSILCIAIGLSVTLLIIKSKLLCVW